jgi:hypothetical protein
METNTHRKPLLPPSDIARRPGGLAVARAAYASMLATVDPQMRGAEKIARERWPSDRNAPLLFEQRATINPASTDTSAWAGTLAADLAGEFIASLQPLSAAARLINAGTKATLAGVNSIMFPKRDGLPSGSMSWIKQGSPMAVKKYSVNGSTLGPQRKLAGSATLTRELVESGNAEQVIGMLLAEDCAASLDASLFSDFAGDDAQPQGLLADVDPLTASAATNSYDAMVDDLESLSGALAAAGSSANVAYILPVRLAQSARLRLLTNDAITIWPSASLTDKIIGVDVAAFASSVADIRIEGATEATMNIEDTTPLPISTPAVDSPPSPQVTAAPVFSMFQMDLISVRVVLSATWVMRQAGLVSMIENPIWGGTPA